MGKAGLFPESFVFVFGCVLFCDGSEAAESLSSFTCEPCFALSPCLTVKNEQLYIATGHVLGDRRSTQPVSEWQRRAEGRRLICFCTNRMGAADFQSGQISRALFF